MDLLSSSSACMPRLSTSAAAGVTLRSPLSIVLDVQAERLPDSKPSAKIILAPPEVKFAVTDLLPSMRMEIGFAVPLASPLQLENVQPEVGEAVNCTDV